MAGAPLFNWCRPSAESIYKTSGAALHAAPGRLKAQTSSDIMFSLFRRAATSTTRYVWVPAVDLTNPRVIASLLSLYAR